MNKPNQPSRKYHHLVVGKIIFALLKEGQTEEDENLDIHAIELNAVITTADGNVGANALGRAQQSLQMHHMKRAGEMAQYIRVQDVVVIGLSHLGLMTDEEFAYIPPAMNEAQKLSANISNGNVTQLRGNKNDQPDPFVEQ